MTSNHAAQAVTPELRLWILEQTRAGHAPQAVLQSMRAAGWDEAVAREALAVVTGGQATPPTARAPSPVAPPAAVTLPEPDLAASPLYLDAGDRRVHVLQAMVNPRVVVFGDLLSDEECEQMIALARPRLARRQEHARLIVRPRVRGSTERRAHQAIRADPGTDPARPDHIFVIGPI